MGVIFLADLTEQFAGQLRSLCRAAVILMMLLYSSIHSYHSKRNRTNEDTNFYPNSKKGFSGALEVVTLKMFPVASLHAPIFLLSYFTTQCFQLRSTFTMPPPFVDFVATGPWGLCTSMSKKFAAFFRFWSADRSYYIDCLVVHFTWNNYIHVIN